MVLCYAIEVDIPIKQDATHAIKSAEAQRYMFRSLSMYIKFNPSQVIQITPIMQPKPSIHKDIADSENSYANTERAEQCFTVTRSRSRSPKLNLSPPLFSA